MDSETLDTRFKQHLDKKASPSLGKKLISLKKIYVRS